MQSFHLCSINCFDIMETPKIYHWRFLWKNNAIKYFVAYLLQNHYTAGTIESYCCLLERLEIDYAICEPSQLYEKIKMRLADSASNVSVRILTIIKVAANRQKTSCCLKTSFMYLSSVLILLYWNKVNSAFYSISEYFVHFILLHELSR